MARVAKPNFLVDEQIVGFRLMPAHARLSPSPVMAPPRGMEHRELDQQSRIYRRAQMRLAPWRAVHLPRNVQLSMKLDLRTAASGSTFRTRTFTTFGRP